MGTRGIIAVQLEGEYRVAQYNQWDSYPIGQGEDIRNFFAQDNFQMDKFRERVDQCSFLNTDQIEMVNAKLKKHGSFEEAGYGYLSRDMGADILQYIYDSAGPVGLIDQLEFVADSLMCEWAYVIDLDKNVLEIFKGFNQTPLDSTERFAHLYKSVEHRGSKQYYPVTLVMTIPLTDLPNFDMCTVEEAVS